MHLEALLPDINALVGSPGRHVLTEMLVDTYIANDTDMGISSGRVHVVTGLGILTSNHLSLGYCG